MQPIQCSQSWRVAEQYFEVCFCFSRPILDFCSGRGAREHKFQLSDITVPVSQTWIRDDRKSLIASSIFFFCSFHTELNRLYLTASNTMVSLSLDGSALSPQQISEALTKVKNEGASTENEETAANTEFTTELTLGEVDFDADQIELFVDVIRSRILRTSASNHPTIPSWDGIHLNNCTGLVNDALLTCTTATNIQQLSLRKSTVNLQTIQCLTYGLKYNHQLRSLHLAIPLDAANSRSLSTALARSTTLHELSLENCTNFEEPGVVMNLSFGLRLNQHLKSLVLDSCYLKDDQVHSVLMSLDGHASLQKLSLQRNACHTRGMAAVATLLHGDLLEELDLSFLVRRTVEERQQQEAKQNEEREAAAAEEKVEDEAKKDAGEDEGTDDAEKEET